MVYQRSFRIEQLNVVKDEFNRIERQYKELAGRAMKFYTAFIVALSALNNFALDGKSD